MEVVVVAVVTASVTAAITAAVTSLIVSVVCCNSVMKHSLEKTDELVIEKIGKLDEYEKKLIRDAYLKE